jgi:hypothetical protein
MKPQTSLEHLVEGLVIAQQRLARSQQEAGQDIRETPLDQILNISTKHQL